VKPTVIGIHVLAGPRFLRTETGIGYRLEEGETS
jgi:hypothetical protein